MSFDGKAFGEEIVAAVKAHVAKAVDPLVARLDGFAMRVDAIAARDVAAFDEGRILARAIESLVPHIDDRVREAVAAMPAPKSVTLDDVRPVIEAEVATAIARFKQPQPQSRNVSSMTINRSGILIAEMDDGWLQSLGPVVEHHATEFSMEYAITNGVRALPKPQKAGAQC